MCHFLSIYIIKNKITIKLNFGRISQHFSDCHTVLSCKKKRVKRALTHLPTCWIQTNSSIVYVGDNITIPVAAQACIVVMEPSVSR